MDEEIQSFYERGLERDRLDQGYSRIEFERTKELLARHLPPPPARILDVGGGPGAYAAPLADAGYEVVLVDASPLHVRQAQELAAGRFSAEQGDARSLAAADESFDAVLLLGPLYHLTERDDRVLALREARRVLRPGGPAVAAAISRFASAIDGMYAGYLSHPEFWPIVQQDLADGQHRSASTELPAFTTAFFHRPEDLRSEVENAGLRLERLVGVEGPGGWFARWPEQAGLVLQAARLAEDAAPELSAHLLAIARR